jgi:hypothetical protein
VALRANHLVGVSADSAGPSSAVHVGAFPSPDGKALTLWRTTRPALNGLRRPTLEEVVMGYVSAGRRAKE